LFFSCFILISPAFCRADSSSDPKTEAVNQQLNMVENSQAAGLNPQEEFPAMQPNAQQEFSNKLQPPRASAWGMVKGIFDPGLDKSTKPQAPTQVITRVHTVDVGGEIFYYRYAEPNPVGIRNQGPMYGFDAGYAYRPAKPNFFNNPLTNVYFVQVRYTDSDDLKYSGDGDIKNKHDDALEYRGLIGKDYYIGADSMVTPYFGFGYRELYDRGKGEMTTTGLLAYDRRSHYYYLPLGGDIVIDLPDNWEFDPNIEYDLFISGWQKSYFSDSPGNADLVNHQDHGFGIRSSIKLLKKGPLVDYYMEPFVRYWHIEESKAEFQVIGGQPGYWVEPDNNTIEVGSEFGIQF
jgi:hypothetical protein